MKWVRLKRICEGILKRKVEINGSTSINGIKAGLVDDGNTAEILINLNLLKKEDDIIKGIAHELAHSILFSDVEDKLHKEKWEELEKIIRFKYYN
jgi:hypothetical protein